MEPVLILFYSRNGATKKLAQAIARGVESAGAEAMLRTVPPLTTDGDGPETATDGPPYVSVNDLAKCSALALGSPTRFGNMAAPLKHFLDSTSEAWLKGALIDKPACVFTSSSSLHGGQETTLLTMMLPLMHHGMVCCGVPYSVPQLHSTQTGGTPYGVSHVAQAGATQLSEDERTLCVIQGKRLASLAQALSNCSHSYGE